MKKIVTKASDKSKGKVVWANSQEIEKCTVKDIEKNTISLLKKASEFLGSIDDSLDNRKEVVITIEIK
jgi:hypothetical protein